MLAEAQMVADLQAVAQMGVRHLGTRLGAEAAHRALLRSQNMLMSQKHKHARGIQE
jgi:hypothetical protein